MASLFEISQIVRLLQSTELGDRRFKQWNPINLLQCRRAGWSATARHSANARAECSRAGAAAGAMRAVCPYVAAPQGSSRKWIRPSSDSGPRRAKSDPWACCLQAQSCKQISEGLGRTTRYEDGVNGSS
ncbi:hypothetical protein PVAP13_8KG136401 [Panicum virgatum]|uniref:Uncharacterized protein n=1 Tax=Panicum virgatum TaxID=38727 RepID=A0A8T0PLE9_PANVG|nr:hypothetical protein PVAP13_8KG136401 [Panicum virgatum]